MRKNRGRVENQLYKRSLVVLKNQVTLSALEEEQVRAHFMRVLELVPRQEFSREIRYLLRQQKVKNSLLLMPAGPRELAQGAPFRLSGDRTAEYYEIILSGCKDALIEFCRLEREFENYLILSNFEAADKVLIQLERLAGHSLWLVRNRILILTLSGNLEAVNDYCAETKTAASDLFTSFLIDCFLFVASAPLLHSKTTIASSISELRSAQMHDWSDFLELLLSPPPNAWQLRPLNCFNVIQSYSVIDLFVLLRRLLPHNTATGATVSPPLEKLSNLLLEISKKASQTNSPDQVSDTCADCEQLGLIPGMSTQDGAIISWNLYDLNNAAKANSLDSARKLDIPPGLLRDLVDALIKVHGLEVQPTDAMDQIRRVSIQVHHLSIGPVVQKLAFESLPNFFKSSEVDYYLGLALLDCNRGGVSPSVSKNHLENSRKEILEAQINELLNSDDQAALRTLSADNLLKNPNCYGALPLQMMMDCIEREMVVDIDSLIIAYYYAKQVSSSKAYILNEIYEEFLIEHDAKKPSDLLTREIAGLSPDKFNFFLREISSTDTLEYLPEFRTSNNLKVERLTILDNLMAKAAIDPPKYHAEVEEILLQSIVDASATEFSVHKIDVNDSAIRRRTAEASESLFQQYKVIAEDVDKGKVIGVESSPTEAIAVVVAGDRNTVLVRLYSLILESFISDDKHGLNKNLSTEIRHGFFSNLMRSKLENQNLITEKGSDGNYSSNEFWRNASALLTLDTVNSIDEHLKWFSGEFNNLIRVAEGWMKIDLEQGVVGGWFDYTLLLHDFDRMRLFAETAKTSAEVVDWILDYLWIRTENNLKKIRDQIDVDFRKQVDQLFSELLDRLDETRGNAPFLDLIAAIRRARNEVKEDISSITNWFRRSDSMPPSAHSLSETVAVSIECYGRVRRAAAGKIFYEKPVASSSLLHGRETKALIISLVNLYENAVRHSGFGLETVTTVQTVEHAGGWEVIVTNPLSEDRCGILNPDALEKIRSRISEPAYQGLIATEGGSGLRKVSNELLALSETLQLSVEVDKGNFRVRISYEDGSDR